MYHKTSKSLVLGCRFTFQITYDICKTQPTEMVSDILDHPVNRIIKEICIHKFNLPKFCCSNSMHFSYEITQSTKGK